MPFLRRILMEATRRAAGDPRVQEKAADILEREVKPRARAVADKARPTVTAARADFRDAAREANPRENPLGFARALKKRFIDLEG